MKKECTGMLIIIFLCMNCCKSAGLVDVAYVLFEHHVDILRKRTVVLLGKFFISAKISASTVMLIFSLSGFMASSPLIYSIIKCYTVLTKAIK